LPENEDAWELWTNVLTQWRVGPNGVIGLDYNAAAMIAGVIEIEFDKVILRKLRALERSVLKGIHEKQDAGDADASALRMVLLSPIATF